VARCEIRGQRQAGNEFSETRLRPARHKTRFSLRLGVRRHAGVQQHARHVAHGPCVMHRVEIHDVARSHGHLLAVVEPDCHLSRQADARVVNLAGFCTAMGMTSLDQRQPGSKTPRPRVKSPSVTTSMWPCPANGRRSLGPVDALIVGHGLAPLRKSDGQTAVPIDGVEVLLTKYAEIRRMCRPFVGFVRLLEGALFSQDIGNRRI
jgi:hypothetical protein